MLNFIPDGYSEPGYIRANPGSHDELRFVYRPMLVADRAVLLTTAGKLAPDLQQRSYGKAIAARLVSWSVTDSKGAPVQPSEDVVLRLRPTLFNRLFDVVAGINPNDHDPIAAADAQTVDEQARLDAAIAGKPYGDVKSEGDVKN